MCVVLTFFYTLFFSPQRISSHPFSCWSVSKVDGLMSKEELEKEFEHNIGSKLYDDIEWIYEQTDIFKNRYDYKLRLVEEENIKFREKMKKLHDKE